MIERVTINGERCETLEDVKRHVRIFVTPPVTKVNDTDDDCAWDAHEFLMCCDPEHTDSSLCGNYQTFTDEQWEQEVNAEREIAEGRDA